LLEVKTGKAAAAVIDLTMANANDREGTDYSDLTILPIEMPARSTPSASACSTATAKLNEVIAAFTTDGTFGFPRGKIRAVRPAHQVIRPHRQGKDEFLISTLSEFYEFRIQ
jgi:hypothetical protein